jgi:S1-C subfamily serine protease
MSDFFLVVSLITMLLGGKGVGAATGFFYLKNETTYLVTNRHVVIDETKGLKPDALRLKLHTDARNITKNVERTIPLYDNARPKWHVHRDYPKVPIDIAVIEIEPKQLEGTIIKSLSREAFFPRDKYILVPGEDIMVLGFPRGFSDEKQNLGLLRNALISSAYGVDFNGVPLFVIDANLHPGMSGSPVMTKPKTILATKTGHAMSQTPVTFFLGIFSATISTVVQSRQQEALGLGIVWYSNLIEQIIDDIRR